MARGTAHFDGCTLPEEVLEQLPPATEPSEWPLAPAMWEGDSSFLDNLNRRKAGRRGRKGGHAK